MYVAKYWLKLLFLSCFAMFYIFKHRKTLLRTDIIHAGSKRCHQINRYGSSKVVECHPKDEVLPDMSFTLICTLHKKSSHIHSESSEFPNILRCPPIFPIPPVTQSFRSVLRDPFTSHIPANTSTALTKS